VSASTLGWRRLIGGIVLLLAVLLVGGYITSEQFQALVAGLIQSITP